MKDQPLTQLQLAMTVVALVLLASCGGDGTPEWAGTIVDSAGVVMVTSPRGGIWTPETRWTVEQDLRIGNIEGDRGSQFGTIGGITVTQDGRIAVLDRQAARISIFTSDGGLERLIGGPGSGPGELGQGSGPLLMGGGDTLIVADLGNGRMNWYTADGRDMGSVTPPPQGRGVPLKWQATHTGHIALQTRGWPIVGQPSDTMDVVTLRTSALEIVDTVLVFRSGESFAVNQGAQEYLWFAPEPSWVIGKDGAIWFGANESQQFSLFGPDGALQRIVNRPGERIRVSERDRELFTEVLEEAWTKAGVPPELQERLRSGTRFAEQLPVFAQLFIGPVESLWVQRVLRPSELTPEQLQLLREIGGRSGLLDQLRGLKDRRWDIYDREGRYLGELELPERFEPVQVVDDHIYGIWFDDLDVQYVLRLKVVRPLSG